MYKTGQVLIVTALAIVAATGLPGFVDGAISIAADNGATVEPIDATSAKVTLAAGTTTITATATAAGSAISADPVSAEAADAADKITLTVTAAD